MDADSWQNCSQREILQLAKVYLALDCPGITGYLLSLVNNPRLFAGRDHGLKRLRENDSFRGLVLQD
jgi:hypothetical protein